MSNILMDTEFIKSDQIPASSNHGDVENIANGDTTLDLLEQKQAQEQARLLHRFRELRQWQLKQQEQLMQQQQQQLEGLRKEQIKVQSILTKQRETQWGAGRVKRRSLSPARTPPRRQINQRDLVTSLLSMASQINEFDQQVVPSSSSLPLPVMYAEPQTNEDDAATNPELFSNPDDSHTGGRDIEVDLQSEDGMFPLHETDSDQSEAYRNVFNIRDSASEFSVGTENEYPPPRTNAYSPEQPSLEFLRTLTADDMNSLQTITTLQHMLQTATPNTLQQMLGILPQKMPNSQIASELLHPDPELGQDKNMNCFQEAGVLQVEKSPGQDVLDEEEEPESQNITVKENENTAGFDDRPIISGIGGKKSFEQLLEEEMLAEEERLKNAEKSPSQSKKPFLRKGQGLSRFNYQKNGPVKTKVKIDSKRKSVEPGASFPTNENQKRRIDQSTHRDAAGNQKQKKDSKIIDSKPPQPSQKTGKSALTNSHKLLSTKHTEFENKPVRSTATLPHQSVPTQSTPVKPESVPSVEGMVHVDAMSETAIDMDEPSFCVKGRQNEKVEKQELEVFELFEDFADNVSFCSNSSVVVRLMEKDWQKKKGVNVPVEEMKAIIQEKLAQKQKEVKMNEKSVQEETPVVDKDDTLNASDSDSSDDTLTDSDSSYTTDSGQDEKTDGQQDKQEEHDYSVSDISQNNNMQTGICFVNNGTNTRTSDNEIRMPVSLSPSKSITRKIASKDIKSGTLTDTHSLLKKLSQNSGSWFGAARENPDVDNFKPGQTHSAFSSEKLNGNAEEAKKHFVSMPQLNGRGDSDDDDSVSSDEVKHQVMTRPVQDRNENAMNDDEEDQFDDDEEWTNSAPKVPNGRDSGIDSTEQASNPSSTPPTSRLVARLFPKLKEAQQAKLQQKQQQDQDKLQSATNAGLGEGLQSKILRDKLIELEKEIEKFRDENAALDKLHREREEGLNKLKKEINNFEKEKADELRRLEEFKTQEMKKIRHERKMFIKYQKAVRAMPDKKDREEIEMLRTELSELQEELKQKQTRWNATNSRLRDTLAQSELENKELREEIKLLEKRRLESMQKENGYKKLNVPNIPRSSTPTEDINLTRSYQGMREPPKAVSPSNVPSTLAQSQPTANGHASTSLSLSISSSKPSAPHQSLSTSGDAVPRGQPTAAATLQGIPQSASTNVPRKQSAKFTSQNPGIDKGDRQYEEIQNPDGKIERTYTNGAREILFSNGTRKEISSDGQSIVVSFFNGDIKQIFPDQRVVYFYADAQTTHTTYPDGLEILQFQNNQIEKHYPDGTKEITFPDQTIKYLFPNGSEESIFPDGTVIRVDSNGDKTMEFPNGQREIHTEQFKKREYPDGTVKTVYPDGRQETRYSTGRIRLKDKDGNVIMDRVC
ncbi:centromere protein J-like [Gigantopelta aegis]|uniref:centromere protein J-like n=1 Tax=Gigantopelta aegis TaxID=1735272 RepID=UPI001B88D3AD|nr:centromere protein J-like [Gigantopelta aegis]